MVIHNSAIIGFETARGSLYRYDANELTTERLKISPGQGQGLWQEKSMCLFVDQQKFEQAKANFGLPHVSLKFGYFSQDQKMLNVLGQTLKDIPPNHTAAIIFFDNNTKQAVAALSAKTDPAFGLVPIEKKYNTNGTSMTHAGNPIVKLERSPFVFDMDVRAALRNLHAGSPSAQQQPVPTPPQQQAQASPVSLKQQFAQDSANGRIL
jgi:hypothetical protein